MRIAFVWAWNKDGTLPFWESLIDSMQHAIAELSKEHSVRVFVVRRINRGRRVINGVDFTFCDLRTATLINLLRQFNPSMIFMNLLIGRKWPAVIKAFPKTWKGMIDHGDHKLKAPLPQKLDAIIVQREYQRKIVARVNNIPLAKTLLNPYCVRDIFRPLPVEKTHTGIMVAVFRANAKRHGLLIRAWKRIPGKLILIGSFNRSRPAGLHRSCMELAEKLGISHKIDFMDEVPNHELPAIINRAKVAYLVSSKEAGSRALPEMMACGLPAIVARDCRGTASLIRHGVDGWIATPTPQGIRDATSKVLKDWRRMGDRASHRIRRDYPYDRMLNFYRGLIKGVENGG